MSIKNNRKLMLEQIKRLRGELKESNESNLQQQYKELEQYFDRMGRKSIGYNVSREFYPRISDGKLQVVVQIDGKRSSTSEMEKLAISRGNMPILPSNYRFTTSVPEDFSGKPMTLASIRKADKMYDDRGYSEYEVGGAALYTIEKKITPTNKSEPEEIGPILVPLALMSKDLIKKIQAVIKKGLGTKNPPNVHHNANKEQTRKLKAAGIEDDIHFKFGSSVAVRVRRHTPETVRKWRNNEFEYTVLPPYFDDYWGYGGKRHKGEAALLKAIYDTVRKSKNYILSNI